LGAAIAGAVAAGQYKSVEQAQKAMTGLKKKVFMPNAKAHSVYKQLYNLYRQMHDAMGTKEWNGNLYNVMKDLLAIRAAARK
jgi:L-ribulokinase